MAMSSTSRCRSCHPTALAAVAICLALIPLAAATADEWRLAPVGEPLRLLREVEGPRMATLADGSTLVVGSDATGIHVVALRADGSIRAVSHLPGEQRALALAAAGDGFALLASGSGGLEVRFLGPAGLPLGAPLTLSALDAAEATATAVGAGRLWVAWVETQLRDEYQRPFDVLQVQRIGPDGRPEAAPSELATADVGGGSGLFGTALARGSGGRVGLAWASGDCGWSGCGAELQARLLDGADGSTTSATSVRSPARAFAVSSPRLRLAWVTTATDSNVTSWSGPFRIRTRGLAGTTVREVHAGAWMDNFQTDRPAIADGSGGRSVVAWTERAGEASPELVLATVIGLAGTGCAATSELVGPADDLADLTLAALPGDIFRLLWREEADGASSVVVRDLRLPPVRPVEGPPEASGEAQSMPPAP